MKTNDLLMLAAAGAVLWLIARKVSAAGTTQPNGWKDLGGGTTVDPSGNYYWGNQMIWRAPGAVQTTGQGGALSAPLYYA